MSVPLMSTMIFSGERSTPRSSIALAIPPLFIVASGKETCDRQFCKEASFSPLATKAISRARPAVAFAAFSIGAGLCRELFNTSIVARSERAIKGRPLLRLCRHGFGSVNNLYGWLLDSDRFVRRHSIGQC